MAHFSVEKGIDKTPTFAWWVPQVIRKKERIISKVKYKYWVIIHKFWIRITNDVEEEFHVYKYNGNHLLWESICKEMKNVCVAFEFFDGEVSEIPIR